MEIKQVCSLGFHCHASQILKQNNLLHIKLNVDNSIQDDWTLQCLNWNNIFLDIEKNI